MNPPHDSVARRYDVMSEPAESPVSIARIVHVLSRYMGVIFLTMTAVALLYLILAIASYLRAPSIRTTVSGRRLSE